jgi:hypothetical protein
MKIRKKARELRKLAALFWRVLHGYYRWEVRHPPAKKRVLNGVRATKKW